jgi:hypothetical protein
MAGVRTAGDAGEEAAGIMKNTDPIPRTPAKSRHVCLPGLTRPDWLALWCRCYVIGAGSTLETSASTSSLGVRPIAPGERGRFDDRPRAERWLGTGLVGE